MAPDERPSRLLVVAAHPGDADLTIAGSVARWVGEGGVAQLVCCTSGDASGDDPGADPLDVARRREEEQRAAATLVGYEAVTFMHQPEGAVADSLALQEQLVRLIRDVRPDALAAPDPRDRIRADGRLASADVRATGEAALDAVQAAPRAMAFAHLALHDGLLPHRVERLYLFDSERSTAIVDVSASLEVKVAALREHAGWPEGSDRVVERARTEAARVGAEVGVPAGEAFAVVDLRT